MVQEPWASRLLDEGKAVALADLRTPAEAARRLGGPTVHAALFVSSDTKLGRAELIPLARALLRALARIRAATQDELGGVLPAAVIGAQEDFALRLRGARAVYLPDGRVSDDALSHSVALVRARTVIPAKVDMPRRLDKLLLMEPLEEALHQRPSRGQSTPQRSRSRRVVETGKPTTLVRQPSTRATSRAPSPWTP
jgi:hypothetical protein